MKTIVKRVLLSRHGIRYPLFKNERMMKVYKKDIVNWNFDKSEMGVLTKKGALVELIAGQNLREIMDIKDDDAIKFYCNTTERTFATARVLSLGLTPYKHQNIYRKNEEFGGLDERFNILIYDDKILNHALVKDIDQKLMPVYERIEQLYGIEKGSLTNSPTKIVLRSDGYIELEGALREATDLADLAILKYYEGMKLDEIFNIEVENVLDEIKFISVAKDKLLEVLFGDKEYILASKDNVYKMLVEELNNDEKIVCLVGHDSNITTITKMLNIDIRVDSRIMIEQFPIGAKLLFEVYDDNTYVLYYIFFHYEDIRNLTFTKPIIKKIKEGVLSEEYNFSDKQ